jgi:dipeptidyl aminopeptidase/acylaminoacyl peptidase
MILKTGGRGKTLRSKSQKTWARVLLLFFLRWIVAGQKPVFSQEAIPMRVEDIVEMRISGSVKQFAPDGQRLAYTVVRRGTTRTVRNDGLEELLRTGRSPEGFDSDIYIADVKTNETRNLTEGKADNWSPAWSPDGRYLAFLSDRDADGQARLWTWDAETDRIKKVLEAPVRLWGPQELVWIPDSHKVLVTIVPEGLSIPEYLKKVGVADRTDQRDKDAARGGTTGIIYRAQPENGKAHSGPWTLDQFLRDLILVDVAEGTSVDLVQGKRISTFQVSGNGQSVAYSSPEQFEKPGAQQELYALRVVTLTSAQEKVFAAGVPLNFSGEFSFSPDGSRLVYCAEGDKSSSFDIYFAAADGSPPRNLTHFASSPVDAGANGGSRWTRTAIPLWNRTGDKVYYLRQGGLWETGVPDGATREIGRIPGHRTRELIAQPGNFLVTPDRGVSTLVMTRDDENKQDGFYKLDLETGASSKLFERQECYTCSPAHRGRVTVASRDGQLFAFSSEDSGHPTDIWVADAGFSKAKRLTHLNAQLDKYKMGTGRLIDWIDDDGVRLRGALLLPSNYEKGKRYPLITLVYGGVNESESLEAFGGFDRSMPYFNLQLYATRGYAVLMPDAPQHMGTAMLDLAKTILPAVSKVIEMGIASPEELGVMGHSYGGYTTLSLLVQTPRFKAAVEANGVADLIGLYGEMAEDGSAFGTTEETGQILVGGTPWQVRDRYIENSPVFYLDRVCTPLLILHGSTDDTVASFLGDELFVDLRRLGKTVDYAKYQGEGHLVTGYANQVDSANRMIEWFDRYLKPRPQN